MYVRIKACGNRTYRYRSHLHWKNCLFPSGCFCLHLPRCIHLCHGRNFCNFTISCTEKEKSHSGYLYRSSCRNPSWLFQSVIIKNKGETFVSPFLNFHIQFMKFRSHSRLLFSLRRFLHVDSQCMPHLFSFDF